MVKRIAMFGYGVASYLVSMGTFLYAAGFIGGFGVPTRLDGERQGSLGAALAVDTALLALFAVQHSVMARRWFKDWWTRLVPRPIERATYLLFSSVALFLMFALWRPMGGTIWAASGAARVVLYALFAFGWALLLYCTFLINHFDLFGLRQVWLALLDRPYTALPFATPGPYRLVRHPLYVGWLVIFWMTPLMTLAHLVFALATTLYILIAIQFEERDLVRDYGQGYEDYRRRVPMLVPSPGGPTTTVATEIHSVST